MLRVQRRIGGLERLVGQHYTICKVQRRIGGLERIDRCDYPYRNVQRRIGGLVVLLNKLKN